MKDEISVTSDESPDLSKEAVILVHGLAANRFVMWPMAKRLRKSGFQAKNYGYFSIAKTIPHHSSRLGAVLDTFENDPTIEKFHLVTHSMGCIISRHLLAQRTFEKLGRWVMLAPPNHGSHAARLLSPVLGRFCTPLTQLSDDPDSFVNQLDDFRDTNDVDFSIIEAAYDRVIDSNCVPLEGQSEYAVVNSMHGVLPWHEEAIAFAERFLTKS
jgi:triacylglycerol esterase/lipase EstA (alpha/beta hydrolase family)